MVAYWKHAKHTEYRSIEFFYFHTEENISSSAIQLSN